MLDFLLEFQNKRIINRTYLVGAGFGHDLFGSISKLEGRDCFFRVIDNRADCCNQCCPSVAPK
jgi:hypothetical protein